MILIYDDLIKTNKADFIAKVQSGCKNILQIDPNWLMGVMYIESQLNPQAVNYQPGDERKGISPRDLALTRGTGLLQFMPKTCKNWGITGQDIYDMNNIQQLDYVFKYLSDFRGKMVAFVDVYFCVFRPSAVGKYFDFVLGGIGTEASKKIAKQNSGLDLNDDEQITKLEVQQKILYSIDKQYHKYLI